MNPKNARSFFFIASRFAVVLICTLILGRTAYAQIDRAELEGTVTDPSGAAVVGTSVKILAVDTDFTQEQRTNSDGYYRFPWPGRRTLHRDGYEYWLQDQGD